ncbi:hypothetical protein LOC68_09675 [Blastopirellula sp. JC732]|uniref:Uncharacterized protein n=1 Tax=Blastopirellula sediminis TaxID=2894196 RepID=A0A9X1MLS1_9BACT|nr:hypothetical protein [Blastopirellula sediminis]MCC9608556.1 hypothetical protein [Blastopirellula sediminis]MCC9628667.1 hypothetical protein [Blastopirellula sediminis]
MTQIQINELVAAATGDDLREIRRHGFQIVGMHEFDLDEEAVPQLVDWDEVDRRRYA